MRTRLFVAAAALSLLSVAGLIAQNRGTITGTVVDDQGTPLPGVAVELTGPDTRKTVSDARGRFSFGLLAPGAYQIRFRLAGFNDVVQAATVQAGATARLMLPMAVASLQESVTVASEAPRVDQRASKDARGAVAELAAAPPPASAPASIVGGAGRPYYPDPTARSRNAAPFNTEAYDRIVDNRVPRASRRIRSRRSRSTSTRRRTPTCGGS